MIRHLLAIILLSVGRVLARTFGWKPRKRTPMQKGAPQNAPSANNIYDLRRRARAGRGRA